MSQFCGKKYTGRMYKGTTSCFMHPFTNKKRHMAWNVHLFGIPTQRKHVCCDSVQRAGNKI